MLLLKIALNAGVTVLQCYSDSVAILLQTIAMLLLQTITVVQVPWGASGIGLILAASRHLSCFKTRILTKTSKDFFGEIACNSDSRFATLILTLKDVFL